MELISRFETGHHCGVLRKILSGADSTLPGLSTTRFRDSRCEQPDYTQRLSTQEIRVSQEQPASDEDDEAMLRLQGGDQRAFDEIVERHSGPLFGFFLKNTRDRSLAEDLTQETFLRVYRQFWNYLPIGRFKGWLYRIARNLLIDNVRRRSHDCLVKAIKGQFEDETDIISTVAGEFIPPEHGADHSELKVVVDEMLDQLPEEQRLTFTLYHFGGLSLPEIAEALDTSVPTTKSRLRLAREKMSAELLDRGFVNPHQSDD